MKKSGKRKMRIFDRLYVYFKYTRPEIRFDRKTLKKYPDYDPSKGKMFGDMIQLYSDTGNPIQSWSDFEIIYHRDTRMYSVNIETCFIGEEGNVRSWELPTLEVYLGHFTKFMDDNKYSKNEKPLLFMASPSISSQAPTIPELYRNFKMFVYGFREVLKEEVANEPKIDKF